MKGGVVKLKAYPLGRKSALVGSIILVIPLNGALLWLKGMGGVHSGSKCKGLKYLYGQWGVRESDDR